MSFEVDNANLVAESPVCAKACTRLWAEVLLEQIGLVKKPNVADKRFEISSARSWFGSRDFFTVCALAGIDGERVLTAMGPYLDQDKDR